MALGAAIGGLIRANLFIALSGDLGAGKTTLTKGLAAGLGLPDTVTSPTFTLVNDYRHGAGARAKRLAHVDLYRLEDGNPEELEGIGFGELLDDLEAGASYGLLVLVVEWAERLGALAPEEGLAIESVTDPTDANARHFVLTARGQDAMALLDAIEEAQQ